jgi:hypothetical protein
MDDPRFNDADVWRAATATPLPVQSTDDGYAEEFALNDIGLALRFSSASRSSQTT